MTAIPTPRRPDDRHWCDRCVECPGCDSGRNRLPRTWVAYIAADGACRAVCTDCMGAAVLCPTRPMVTAAEPVVVARREATA